MSEAPRRGLLAMSGIAVLALLVWAAPAGADAGNPVPAVSQQLVQSYEDLQQQSGLAPLVAGITDPYFGSAANNGDPPQFGQFSNPFAEPGIHGITTDDKCVQNDGGADQDGLIFDCKPTAVAVSVLPNGNVMYYDGLEGTENVQTSIVIEYGSRAINDQSRLLNLNNGNPQWSIPTPEDGGAAPASNEAVLPPPLTLGKSYNSGALFCTDVKFLPDGRVLANGGTGYYFEPGVDLGNGVKYGVSELEGLKSTRIYDPATNSWNQVGDMNWGRWYPTTVTLPDGDLFTASGVTKLLKPVYPDRPLDSLTNVKETETFSPLSGKWSYNGAAADRSLPLYPRLSVLPDGKIFYNAAGQSFNPFGQSYDEALWNLAAAYDPQTKTWKELGIPGLDSGSALGDTDLGNPVGDLVGRGIPGGGSAFTIPGFRGSTFSIMLPLKPDAGGGYTKASYLTAGGVLNPPSPGSYFATSDSRITTVDTANGDQMSTHPTGDLAEPRWYPSGVLLPTGQVLAFNGSDRDEVAGPGTEIPIRKTEMFDPATSKWTTLASSHQPRTYHNTAVLLPDGRVLIGGHAPISTLYARNITLLKGVTAPNDGRDPSFEIYSPPYLYWGARPVIHSAPDRIGYDGTIQVTTDTPSADIDSVVLVRNPSLTHLVDADQRNVELKVVSRQGNTLTLAAPPNANVAPPGPYMLFVNKTSSKGLIPSTSKQTFVGISGLEARAASRP
jgi:hypothetical protein